MCLCVEMDSSSKSLFSRDVYKIKYSVFLLSVWYSQSSSMVNVFGDSVASGKSASGEESRYNSGPV